MISVRYHPDFVYKLSLVFRIEPVDRADDIFRALLQSAGDGLDFGFQKGKEVGGEEYSGVWAM